MKRLRITIPAGTAAADLEDFPVVVRLPEAAPPGACEFTDSSGRELPWVRFGTPGESLVRVRLPEVTAAADTVFFAVPGGSGPGNHEDPFTRSCRFPASGESVRATDKSSRGNGGGRALTVESWIRAGESRAEQMQVIASQWPLAAALERFATYDAGATDGLETQGFFGAMCDGRYVYFSPQCNTTGRHGTALRYDTHGGFDDPGSWSARDAGRTSGLDTTGYYGVVCAGRYVYYAPRHNSAGELHAAMLRYDAGNGDFRDPAAWEAFDLGLARSSQGCAFDGRYIYYVPGYDGNGGGSGLVIRYDTAAPFDEADSYETWDAGNTGGVACSCYDGAVFDGRHVYFAPLSRRGNMLRYDTRLPFADPGSWEACDIRGATDPPIAMCVGAVFDGRYVYYAPYGDNAAVVRFDTGARFEAGAGWEARDVAGTSGLECRGFDGALFDGRYVYFIPFYSGGGESGFHCELLRYDTSMEFADGDAWSAADGSLLAPPNPGGFNGGAFDGRFLYFAPWRKDGEPGDPTGDGSIFPHGQVLRYDTAGEGARFLLKYMDCGHNGGLGASVPGPVFTVNTETGPVSARANCNPGPGWHHVAGVYDGEEARLYIDGTLAGTAKGKGELAAGSAGVEVGELEGCSRLDGEVAHLRVEERVRSGAWIRAAAENMRAPDEFARVSEEG